MSKNYLNLLPRNIFKGLARLQTLVLSLNNLRKFDVNITHMKNLTYLDLSDNKIPFFPQFIMDHLDRVAESGNDVTVDLNFQRHCLYV